MRTSGTSGDGLPNPKQHRHHEDTGMPKPVVHKIERNGYFVGQRLPEFLLEVEDGDINPRFDYDQEDNHER